MAEDVLRQNNYGRELGEKRDCGFRIREGHKRYLEDHRNEWKYAVMGVSGRWGEPSRKCQRPRA